MVIGGGKVALRKVKALLEHGARVQVISPDPCLELSQLAKNGTLELLPRDYSWGDLEDAFVVVAATDDSSINKRVAEEARKRGVLVNVVDDPEKSDFIMPSYLRRGDITIAVSTGGRSPTLARKIRTRLEENFGAEYASLALLVGDIRSDLRKRKIKVNSEDWQEALDIDLLIEMLKGGRIDEARASLLSSLAKLGRGEE